MILPKYFSLMIWERKIKRIRRR